MNWKLARSLALWVHNCFILFQVKCLARSDGKSYRECRELFRLYVSSEFGFCSRMAPSSLGILVFTDQHSKNDKLLDLLNKLSAESLLTRKFRKRKFVRSHEMCNTFRRDFHCSLIFMQSTFESAVNLSTSYVETFSLFNQFAQSIKIFCIFSTSSVQSHGKSLLNFCWRKHFHDQLALANYEWKYFGLWKNFLLFLKSMNLKKCLQIYQKTCSRSMMSWQGKISIYC